MSGSDLVTICIIGGVFIILGIIGVIWGKIEEGSWYSSVSTRIDVREFLDRAPGRPEPGALKIGGRICLAIGIIILLVGLGFKLWGQT
jgi:hypothetical protein